MIGNTNKGRINASQHAKRRGEDVMRLTKKRKEFMRSMLSKSHALVSLVDMDCPDQEFKECYGVTKKFASEALQAVVESLN